MGLESTLMGWRVLAHSGKSGMFVMCLSLRIY
jgi:hypothetical protein